MLSSGTWEILMVRSAQVDTSLLCDYSGSTCELDSQPGRYNPGMQWLASGVLEWVRKLLWSADTPWQTLIAEAQAIPPGAQGVRMQCDLLASQHAELAGRHAQHHPRPFLPRRAGGVKRPAGAASANPGKHRPLQGERAAAGGRRQPQRAVEPDQGRPSLEYRSKFSMMPKPRWLRRGDVWLVWRGRVLFAGTGQSAGRVPLPLFLAAN